MLQRDEIIWQNEVLKMAEACGFTRTHTGLECYFEVQLWLSNTKDLEAFAKLAAAAAASKEREACAKECDNADYLGIAAHHCANAIRARGEA